MVLAHTVEAMVGNKPTRVHCNTCKSQHSYKASPPSARQSAPRDAAAAPRQPGKGRVSKYQSLLNSRSTAVAKTYSPKDKYEPGDVLEHPTFGRGVTTAIKDGTKIEVLFEMGSKTLIHGR
jgi:hypothetical protein